MKNISILFLATSLLASSVLFAQEEDSCNAFTTKKQCHKEGKSKCTWLESKEICKSKDAIAKEKDAEKNLKRKKKGGDE
ncbi:MAG: hypothetical protein IPL26_07330 [Leptospiraceae bacterium]|nr:hypothetical protein [Leptospiraceae bacterium]